MENQRISRTMSTSATRTPVDLLRTGTVRNLVLGRFDPSHSTMLALVEALNLSSIEELLGPLPTGDLLVAHSNDVEQTR